MDFLTKLMTKLFPKLMTGKNKAPSYLAGKDKKM